MPSLAGLPKLKRLRIRFCDITGEGIKHIAGASNMARLELRNSSVDDEGLAVIAKFPKLTYLDLSECKLISAEGIKQLKALTGLTYAGFWDTKLDDDCAQGVGWTLVNLTVLDVKATDISDEAVDTILKFSKTPRTQRRRSLSTHRRRVCKTGSIAQAEKNQRCQYANRFRRIRCLGRKQRGSRDHRV